MIGLFKTLIIIAVIYFLLRFVTRVLLPIFVGNYINQKVSQAQGNNNKQETKRREGEVTIKNASSGGKKFQGNDGEYVDFEEIKE